MCTKTILHKLLILLAVSTGLSSCYTSRQFVPLALENTNASTDARIYVVRSASVFGSAIPFAIYSDSMRVGQLGAGGYLCWQVPKGNHVVTIGGETKKKYPLIVSAGEDYYFKAVPQIGIFVPRAKLKAVHAAEALTKLVESQRPMEQ